MKNRRQFLYIEKKNHSCFFSSLFLLLFPRLLNLENKKKILCKKKRRKKKREKKWGMRQVAAMGVPQIMIRSLLGSDEFVNIRVILKR